MFSVVTTKMSVTHNIDVFVSSDPVYKNQIPSTPCLHPKMARSVGNIRKEFSSKRSESLHDFEKWLPKMCSFIYSLMIHIFKKYIRNCFPLSEGDAHQIPLYTSHEIP